MTPSQSETQDEDSARRFGGVARLYGEAGLAQLQAAHVCVIGLGGVGSWAAEALARNAIGRLTLIDLDNLALSNVNRQLPAMDGNFGQAKISAMAERMRLINPQISVSEIEDFISPDNLSQLLPSDLDGVVDCIDDAKAKAALAAYCQSHGLPLVVTGAAGGRLDATRIKTADLSVVSHDKLLAKVRNLLRRDYGFAKASTGQAKPKKMAVLCVYSDESVIEPDAVCADVEPRTEARAGVTGLNCAGYGSSVCVTAPFGFVAAGLIIKALLAS
jgi:tRNA A37 threonylcarbamoyladenosine dehydratase